MGDKEKNIFNNIKMFKGNRFEIIGKCSIPKAPGVYFVLFEKSKMPEFCNPGTGGYFKNRNPNVETKILKEKWVDGTCVLYIGKAKNLRQRIAAYLAFGLGVRVGHWGGRYIWQIKRNKKLLICWKECKNPRQEEKKLIGSFKKKYEKLPFANLRR